MSPKVIGTAWSLGKALVMTAAVVTLAAAEPFWHQLLLVAISSGATGLSLILAAHITARRVEKRVEEAHQELAATVTDVSKKIGAARRATDTERRP